MSVFELYFDRSGWYYNILLVPIPFFFFFSAAGGALSTPPLGALNIYIYMFGVFVSLLEILF